LGTTPTLSAGEIKRDKVREESRDGGGGGGWLCDAEACLLLDVAGRNLTFYGNTGLLLL